jgi:ferredoxin
MTTCPHFALSEIPSCIALTSGVYANVQAFIAGNLPVREIRTLFPLVVAGCLTRDAESNSIKVNREKCIGCGFCIAGCPSRSFALIDSIQPNSQCGSGFKFSSDHFKLLKSDNISNQVFPKLSIAVTDNKSAEHQSISNFTGSDEVKNLSPWAAQLASYICGEESQVALEVHIEIEGMPRAGRLDVCVRSEHGFFIFESKKNFKSMMIENRIFDQILDYRYEIDQIKADHVPQSQRRLFTLIGGEETDLFPENHPECSSFDLEASKRLFEWLQKNNGKVVSAQGLLWLAFRDFTKQNQPSVEVLKTFYSDSSAMILTSRGQVQAHRGSFSLKTLPT